MVKALFLDRDGVINHPVRLNNKPYAPLHIKNVFIIPQILEVVRTAHELGYLVLVVTSQPDVADKLVTKRTIVKINEYLKSIVKFDDIFVCYHNRKDNCNCKKPKIGLFEQADAKYLYSIDFKSSYMVGDRWSDIEAGKRVGCKTIFVDYNYDEPHPESPDYTIPSFQKISEISDILKNSRR